MIEMSEEEILENQPVVVESQPVILENMVINNLPPKDKAEKKKKNTNPNNNGGRAMAVEQIDLQTDAVLERFPSERAAAASLGLDRAGICKCVKGGQTSSGGFGWRKAAVSAEEEETLRCGGRAPMAVERLDIETGAVQERYPSLSAAATALGLHYKNGIWKCIKGERKSASGYAWRKAEGDDNGATNLAVTNISGLAALKSVIKVAAKTEFDRPVEQRDQFGRLIKTHKSVKSITCFVPTQKVITKICEEGGGEVTLDEGKTFRFRYKKMPVGNNALTGAAGVLGIPLPMGNGSVAATGIITKKRNRSIFDAHHNQLDAAGLLRIPSSSSSSGSIGGSSSSSSSSSGTNNQAAVDVVFKQPAPFAGWEPAKHLRSSWESLVETAGSLHASVLGLAPSPHK